jgi:hypothetical protein
MGFNYDFCGAAIQETNVSKWVSFDCPASRAPGPSIVGCSRDSGGTVYGRLFVGQCHRRLEQVQQISSLDNLVGAREQ